MTSRIFRPVRLICGCGRPLKGERRSMNTVIVPRHKCPVIAPEHLRTQADALAGWCPIRGVKLLSDYAGPGGSVSLDPTPTPR